MCFLTFRLYVFSGRSYGLKGHCVRCGYDMALYVGLWLFPTLSLHQHVVWLNSFASELSEFLISLKLESLPQIPASNNENHLNIAVLPSLIEAI